MKYNELFSLIPGASVERDNDGQIVIYTGLSEGTAKEGQSRDDVELVVFELDDEGGDDV